MHIDNLRNRRKIFLQYLVNFVSFLFSSMGYIAMCYGLIDYKYSVKNILQSVSHISDWEYKSCFNECLLFFLECLHLSLHKHSGKTR